MKTVVFDFDGVIHSYVSGWKGIDNIPDPPVEGIKEVIDTIRREDGYRVAVVSTRCSEEKGKIAIQEYLKKHDIVVDYVLKEKPPAVVYIDDRAIRFNGKTDGLVDQIKGFKNWIEESKEDKRMFDDDYDHLNIIFLDVDGVLNSSAYFSDIDKRKKVNGRYNDIYDYHVELLSHIYKQTNAIIILSSTWKELDDENDPKSDVYKHYNYLVDSLSKYGMTIHGKTPYLKNNRPLEIKTWLENNIRDMSKVNFISLDDDFSEDKYAKYGIENCLVKTNFYCSKIEDGGIQPEHVEKALDILNTRYGVYMSPLVKTPILSDYDSTEDGKILLESTKKGIDVLRSIGTVEELSITKGVDDDWTSKTSELPKWSKLD